MIYSHDKNIDELVQKIVQAKVADVERGSKHWAILKNNGEKYPIPGTPSDGRTFINWKVGVERFLNIDTNELVNVDKEKRREAALANREENIEYFTPPEKDNEMLTTIEKKKELSVDELDIDELEALLMKKKTARYEEVKGKIETLVQREAEVNKEIADYSQMITQLREEGSKIRIELHQLRKFAPPVTKVQQLPYLGPDRNKPGPKTNTMTDFSPEVVKAILTQPNVPMMGSGRINRRAALRQYLGCEPTQYQLNLFGSISQELYPTDPV